MAAAEPITRQRNTWVTRGTERADPETTMMQPPPSYDPAAYFSERA
jgi:hypothetical protein